MDIPILSTIFRISIPKKLIFSILGGLCAMACYYSASRQLHGFSQSRIVLPLSVDEFKTAQLYTVAQASKNETGGGEGFEWVVNEPAEGVIKNATLHKDEVVKSQYTHKIIHLNSKVPAFVRLLAPTGSLEVHENAWNAYPYCHTEYSNTYMKGNFTLTVDTVFAEGNGQIDNAHGLSQDALATRKIITIDIANNASVSSQDYKEDEDPTKYNSQKTGRGPIQGNWQNDVSPVMCCYKLVKCEFIWFGLQDRVEKIIQRALYRTLLNQHRQAFCWTDEWFGLSLDEVRALEEQTKRDLDKQRHEESVRGMFEK